MFDINDELKKLPDKPGVYIMKNEYGNIIYVGKAINLKNRVRQYFYSPKEQTPKVKLMVSKIKSFEYIITESEMEALILECNLIKKYKPKFNILLKDDKSYPYIKITVNEEYPRILITRKVVKDKAKYFGPYTSAGDVRETIKFIRKVFPIRNCNRKIGNNNNKRKMRPCLDYYIHQCSAPCAGLVDKDEYNKLVKDACQFLYGNKESLLQNLENEMIKESENMNFEKAAELRDKIAGINNLFQHQNVLLQKLIDEDVLAFAREDNYLCIQVFFSREGKIVGRENFIFNNMEEDNKEILSSFIKQYYNSSEFIPREILIQEEIDDMNLIEKWLSEKRGGKVCLKIPKRAEKFQLMNMAQNNAAIYLENHVKTIKMEKIAYENAQKKLMALLGIDKYIEKIEAYDISNTGFSEITGSMVVFENGKPLKENYRRFKIKSLNKQNDYKSMQEIIYRRFKKGEESIPYPELILIDGGVGHVNAATEVLKRLKIDIPILGMVKDNKHHTKGLISINGAYDLSNEDSLLKLITLIQNEAHRFAIGYNKKLRSKRYKKSILDEIPGIGEKRKEELMKHFGSVNEIKNAEIDELATVQGINRKIAENVYNFFKYGNI